MPTTKKTEHGDGGVSEAKRRPPTSAELSDVVGEPSLRGGALGLGDIFPLLDMVAGRCAAVYAGGSVVTGCFDRVIMHSIALHGDVVVAIASIVTVGSRSLLLRIDAFAEPRRVTAKTCDSVLNTTIGTTRIPLVSALATFVADASLVPLPEFHGKMNDAHFAAPVTPDVSINSDAAQFAAVLKSERYVLRGHDSFPPSMSGHVADIYSHLRDNAQHARCTVPASGTRIRIRKQFLPRNLNFRGVVFGGDILSSLDRVAVSCATRLLNTACVTRRVRCLSFWKPIEPRIALQIDATAVATGPSVVCVFVQTLVDHRHDGVDMIPSHAGVFLVVPLLKDSQSYDKTPDIAVLPASSMNEEHGEEFYRAIAICSPGDFEDTGLKM